MHAGRQAAARGLLNPVRRRRRVAARGAGESFGRPAAPTGAPGCRAQCHRRGDRVPGATPTSLGRAIRFASCAPAPSPGRTGHRTRSRRLLGGGPGPCRPAQHHMAGAIPRALTAAPKASPPSPPPGMHPSGPKQRTHPRTRGARPCRGGRPTKRTAQEPPRGLRAAPWLPTSLDYVMVGSEAV